MKGATMKSVACELIKKSSSPGLKLVLCIFAYGASVSVFDVPAQRQKVESLEKVASTGATESTESKVNVPESWQKVDAEGKFTFHLPPGMKQTDFAGVDSFLREYSDGRMRLIFVYPPDDFLGDDREAKEKEFGEGYEETSTKIAGKPARVFTYRKIENDQQMYVTEVHFGNLSRGRTDLWMWVSSPDPSDLEVAKQVFYSVRIP